jgi:hypothetical protein
MNKSLRGDWRRRNRASKLVKEAHTRLLVCRFAAITGRNPLFVSVYTMHGGNDASRRRLCGVANAPLWGVPRRCRRHLAGEPAAPRSRLPRQTSRRERSRAAGVPGHASRRRPLPNATLASVQLAAGAPTRTDDARLLDAAAPLRGRSRTGSRRARVRRVAGEPAARRRTGDTRPAGGGLHLGRNRHTVGR